MSLRFVLLLSLCAPLMLADQVTLLNGDRITGKIVSADAKVIVVKTAAMGEVKIERGAVASLSSEEPLTVTLKKGEKLVGVVQLEPAQTVVTTSEGKAVPIAPAEVDAIRTAAAQKAWDREQTRLHHPPLFDFWSGTIGLNLASSSGNARTSTFGTGATAQRATGLDKLSFTYSQIYSTQSTTEPHGKTANRVSGGVRYDRTVSGKLFASAVNTYDFDEFLSLDLRAALGAGLGYHAIKNKKTTWDFGLGSDWNREKFSTGLLRNSAELTASEESSHQITNMLRLSQRLSAYPNLTRGGDYRVNFDGTASVKLTKALSWNITVTDHYLSNPIDGKRRNDLLITTGIGIRFEQK